MHQHGAKTKQQENNDWLRFQCLPGGGCSLILTLLREIPANREKYWELNALGPEFCGTGAAKRHISVRGMDQKPKTIRDLTGLLFPETASN
jgi:hypothetical protein